MTTEELVTKVRGVLASSRIRGNLIRFDTSGEFPPTKECLVESLCDAVERLRIMLNEAGLAVAHETGTSWGFYERLRQAEQQRDTLLAACEHAQKTLRALHVHDDAVVLCEVDHAIAQVRQEPAREKCTRCKGTGLIPRDELAGMQIDHHQFPKCGRCHGTGQEPEKPPGPPSPPKPPAHRVA